MLSGYAKTGDGEDKTEGDSRRKKLPNGMTAYLRKTDLAPDHIYLALSVKVGSLRDAGEKGISHLLEHCNMGFEKYRKPFPFLYYLARAYTDYYSTNYIFSCKKQELKTVISILFEVFDGEKIKSHKNMDILLQYRKVADGTLDAILNLRIFVVGGIFLVRGELTVGSLYAMISYTSYVLNPLSSILNLKLVLTNILPSAARFFEFMDQEEEQEEGSEVPFALKNFCTDIECKDIFFRYQAETAKKDVIQGLCLKIRQGEKIALIGQNGCGKTTLVHLLLRLYDCKDGCIRMGGEDVSKFNRREYRKLFSVVSQQIYLFHDTIRNNICMSQEFPEEAVRAVIDQVGLGKLLAERGLDDMVGINGSRLSGGQKQKIALARALLYNRPIFIFDEATSNTDIDFEVRFRRMLKEELVGKTVILVTHNAELLREADRIVWIGEGKVSCEGSYEELLEHNAEFSGLIEQYRGS